jgi:hypothetical protein
MSDLGQALGTVVGGVIGFVIGGPEGARRGAALGYSLTAPRPEEQSPTYGFGQEYNTASQTIPVPVVYGYNKVAGNIIYKKVTGDDNEKMALQVAVSEGPIEEITKVMADGVDITSKCTIKLGDRTQAAGSINDQGQTFPYTAYISVELTANENISGNPTITCLVKGRKIEVRDGDSWVTEYSQNPAYCLLDFLSNKRYGLGISEDDIDLNSIIDVGDYCDELVDGEPRFQLDYVIDYQKSSLDHIQDILATLRGFLIYSAGEFRLKVDGPEEPVQSFTMNNIITDSFQYWKSSRKERYNRIVVEYTDPDEEWEKIGAQTGVDSDIQKRGPVEETIPLLGINRFSQAGRMSKYFQKKSWYCPTFCQFKVGIDSLHCEAGDVTTVTHDVPGWIEKLVRILAIQEDENDEMLLTCQEYNVAVYSDSGVVQQVKKDSDLPNPFEAPASVENLTLNKEFKQLDDGTWLSGIVVDAEKPDRIVWTFGNIYLSEDDGTAWELIDKTDDFPYKISNVAQPATYLVKVVSENKFGIKENFDSAPEKEITIYGKDVPPDDVQNFHIQMSGDSVALKWDKVDDKDIDGYEIREGNSWFTGTVIDDRIKAGSHNMGELQPGEWNFFIKAIDRSGNYSVNEATTEITTFNTSVKNIINTFHDDYSGGSFDNTDRYYDSDEDAYFIGTSEDGSGGWILNGTYTSPVRDIGKIMKVRTYINYYIWARGDDLIWNNYDMIWTEFADLSANSSWKGLIEAGKLNINLYYSEDDINWNTISSFIAATINARYLKVEFKFENFSTNNQLIVDEYDLKVDVPDTLDSGIVNVDGTKTVNYNFDFYEVKSITLTVMSDNEYQARVTNYGTNSFDIKATDGSGNLVQSDISWQALGY